jgi:hypothetical protein
VLIVQVVLVDVLRVDMESLMCSGVPLCFGTVAPAWCSGWIRGSELVW